MDKISDLFASKSHILTKACMFAENDVSRGGQNTLTLAERTIERMIDRSVASTIVYSSLLYFSLESSA